MSDKHEDRFFREFLSESGSERVTDDFSDSVMRRIRAERPVIVQPLVSTRGWLVIACGIMALTGLAVFGGGTPSGAGWYGDLIGWLDRLTLPTLQWPQLPDTLTYGALALMVFTLLQLLWLRRFYFRRLTDSGYYPR